MASVIRWHDSSEVVLNKFSPLKNQNDETADESDREMQDISQFPRPRKEEDDLTDLSNIYTVEEAVQKIGFGVFQVLLSLFCGAIWLVEALEVMILAILSAALKCEWNLSSVEEATITMVVFFGSLIGNLIWGTVADKFGRKKALLGTLIWTFLFGFISAFSPNYYTILLFRGLAGVGLGGDFLAPTYCLEFLPVKSRSTIFCLLEFAWAMGSIFEALLALVVMTSIDHEPWRWLLGFSAIPLLVMILLFPLVPESPRYLIIHNKEEKAKKVLALIAWVNCKSPVSGKLVTQEEKEELLQRRNEMSSPVDDIIETSMTETEDETPKIESEPKEDGALLNDEENDSKMVANGDVIVMSSDNESDHELLIASDECTHRQTVFQMCIKQKIKEKAITYYHWSLILFQKGYWRTTLLLWYIWWACSILYYGGTLLTTSVFQYDEHCGLKGDNDTGDGTCKPLSKSDYIHLVWTACAEFPGTTWIIILLLITGRKKSMALTAAAAAICCGLLFLCLGKIVLTIFLFGIRGFASGLYQAMGLYTPEVYPTTVRGFGMSLCSGFGHFGAMCAPFIAQTIMAYNAIAAISIFITVTVMISIAALLLPIETRGRAMKDSGH